MPRLLFQQIPRNRGSSAAAMDGDDRPRAAASQHRRLNRGGERKAFDEPPNAAGPMRLLSGVMPAAEQGPIGPRLTSARSPSARRSLRYRRAVQSSRVPAALVFRYCVWRLRSGSAGRAVGAIAPLPALRGSQMRSPLVVDVGRCAPSVTAFGEPCPAFLEPPGGWACRVCTQPSEVVRWKNVVQHCLQGPRLS